MSLSSWTNTPLREIQKKQRRVVTDSCFSSHILPCCSGMAQAGQLVERSQSEFALWKRTREEAGKRAGQ